MNFEKMIENANSLSLRYQEKINETVHRNLNKVLTSFRKHRIADLHLQSSTGYGYNDIGRDTFEEMFAEIFGGQDALVRQQIVSGTHAMALSYFGVLLPGDELICIGKPYDTLQKVIGTEEKEQGTLRELGVNYREFPLTGNGTLDIEKLINALSVKTKMISIQRSKGYQWRSSLTIEQIKELTAAIKKRFPHIVVFVDNCYGEFVEEQEPLEVGVDLMAGSLIKNPGGGVAPGGGYIVGRHDLIVRVADRLTAPGIGKEVGPSLGNNRLFYQGLFNAPHVVGEALAGAVFTAALFSQLGFEVLPKPEDYRTDIIQAVKLKEKPRLIRFCQGIQKYSPVDSHVSPEPWKMPGYQDPVIMAAGTFIQGASIELSADAPIREPYIVYIQGGTSRHHVKLAVTETLKDMIRDGHI